ncbi:MAG: sensor domain-containing diguanylate cyclase [Catonella sp.]|uniref:sensor domain-containing diguanylate cyclase n=1 Tax=Catonella sp. TaxID=2382125 RepID=UPI003FA1843E
MDKEVVLQLSSEQLYDEFVENVLSNPIEFEGLVSELEKSRRFREDFIFRIHVQTSRQFIFVCQPKSGEALEKGEELIERAHALNLPKILTLNYHILGIAYKFLNIVEKALECFMNVLKYSRIYNLNNLTSIVYFYISELYMVHEDANTALDYLHKALSTLEETKEQEPRYEMKKVLFSANMVQLLYETKQYEKIEQYVKVMHAHFESNSNQQAFLNYKVAMLVYLFAQNNYEEAQKNFYELLDLMGDSGNKYVVLKGYCEMLYKRNIDYDFYEKELLLLQTWGDSEDPYINYLLNNYLYKYFEKKGDKDGAFDSLKKSFNYIEKEMLELKSDKVNSFKIIEKKCYIEEDVSRIEQKNNELKLIVDEANKNKNIAESALHRLKVVNELGKKLTYSLDVQDIIKTVYSKLMKNIPLNNFIIMVKNSDLNRLESIAYYEDGEVKDRMILDFEDEYSFFVETFKTNTFTKTDDFNENERFEKKRDETSDTFYRSALFLPLSFEDEVLGVCSIQHEDPNIYKEEDIEFLEQLMPYLTIALNNAFKSQALEYEINHHKKTQNELKEVNQKLEELSYLDGLTQISNRRDFEKKILGYLQKSREQGLSLSLFMFDIDYFKLYNDTYGHLKGDNALKTVATIIQKHFSEAGGISARFGGEEFVAACLGLDEEESTRLGNKIKEDVFAQGIENEKVPLKKLSISIGISYSDGLEKLKKSFIMRWADVSLYQAKRDGKNRVILKAVHAGEEPPEGLE